MPPPVNIVGTPVASLAYRGDNPESTANVVRISFVRFSLRAEMQVQAPQGTSLSDWEVGTLQMVTSGAIDSNCYRNLDNPGAQVIINALALPPGAYFSDRNWDSQIFTELRRVVQLGQYTAGQRFQIQMEDNPNMTASSAASIYTHDERDGRALLARHIHNGYFHSYIAARQISTGQITPLYTVEWFFTALYNFVSPGSGLPMTPYLERNMYRIVRRGPYTNPPDPVPVVTPTPFNIIARDSRRTFRQTSCPELIGSMIHSLY